MRNSIATLDHARDSQSYDEPRDGPDEDGQAGDRARAGGGEALLVAIHELLREVTFDAPASRAHAARLVLGKTRKA